MHVTSPNQAQQDPAIAGASRSTVGVWSVAGDLLQVLAVTVDATQSTVQVEGELDMATARLLELVLDDELQQGRRFVRLDLSRLSFMDCSGVRALVRAHHRFLASRGTVVLTGVGPAVTRLLDITGLTDALFVADSASVAARPRRLVFVAGRR